MSNYTKNKLVKNENHAWSMIFSMIPGKSTVLDIGCSSGNLGNELIEKKHCIVDGIELDLTDSKIAAKKLRKVWNLNIESDDLSVIDGQYDVIILADVIEHLVQPAEALKRIKCLLKPNGKLVFSVPNMAHISVRLDLLAGRFRYTETGLLDRTHLRYFDSEEIVRVLNDGGLVLKKINYPQIRYPRMLIDKKLQKLGIGATDEFYKNIEKPEYYAYQFIGIAEYAKAPYRNAKLASKQAIQTDFTELAEEISRNKSKLEKLKNEAEYYRQESEDAIRRLEAITKSRPYKVARKAVHIARLIKKQS